jgi:hypothetical protein
MKDLILSLLLDRCKHAIQEYFTASSEIPLHFVLEIALNSVPNNACLPVGLNGKIIKLLLL